MKTRNAVLAMIVVHEDEIVSLDYTVSASRACNVMVKLPYATELLPMVVKAEDIAALLDW